MLLPFFLVSKTNVIDQTFDIFRIVTEQEIHWIESSTSLAKAKARIGDLGAKFPGKYMILGKPSGERTVIVAGAASRNK